ncbi:MAG: DUF2341 domain-containing protein [Myxococcota bacterium]
MPLKSTTIATSTASVGLGLLAAATGCPTAQPVIPERPATTTDSDEPSTGPTTTSSGLTEPETSASSSGSLGPTTADITEGSSTTLGEQACPLELRCSPSADDWWDDDWAYRRRIDITSTLASDLSDAVVPIRLDDTFEHGCAAADGVDLRFVDEGGTVLAHELDEWSPESGSVAWVRLPLLTPSGASIWLYYGNLGNPTAGPPATEVWPGSLYEAVLHFGGDLEDARGMHDGQTPGLSPVFAGDGILGQAIHYEPRLVDARTELSDSASIDDAIIASEALTATAWIRSTPDVASDTPFRGIVGRGSDQWGMTVHDVEEGYDFRPPCYAMFNTDCIADNCDPPVDFANNQFLTGQNPVIEDLVVAVWHHVAVVYEPLGDDLFHKRIYVDGVLDVDLVGTLPMPWENLGLHVDPYTIGTGPTDSESVMYHGEIDEVHLASVAWDGERVRAEHDFVGDPSLVALADAECR